MCFLSDRADAKLGLLPSWYLPLRGWLTTLSMLSMLATTTYFVAKDVAKVRARMAEEDNAKAAKLAARHDTERTASESPAKQAGRWRG
ncbi:uncharacterized protein HaLaN_24131 [Haematococcus lacustris]|uniref:Uncharacterized protein n=1 Tax=Haematococcus lacustris TaxID=44745 RepID=A0A6A0A4P4_HAELA|nr:uncharacterized protein HaLaN_24131 [Haematococcus lacustris]